MKKFLKFLELALLLLIVLALALSYAPDTDPDDMLAKYGDDQALFTTMESGAKLHYRDQGPEDAPVIVMIHGMSSHLQTWEPLIDEMGDGYRILSLDLPGFGLTGPNPTGDYGADLYGEAAIAVMDAANVETAVIMGNSMGGWTAWRMGLSYPDRIEGLVLLDPWGAPGDANESSNIGFKLMQSSIGQALMPHFTPRSLVKSSVYQTVERDEIVTEEMVDRYYELLRYPGNRKAALDAMKRAEELSAWDNISNLAMPVLILWGREDQLIDVSKADLFAKNIPDSTLIIYDGIGHLPMEENPKDVARDVKAWWADKGIGG